MKTIIILEFAFMVIGAAFLITQVVIPFIMNHPLFPLLRSKNRELGKKLASTFEEVEQQGVEDQIRLIRRSQKQRRAK